MALAKGGEVEFYNPIFFFNLDLKRRKNFGGGGLIFFLEPISLGNLGVSSPKIVIRLSRTYEKLHCKGEPFRSSG